METILFLFKDFDLNINIIKAVIDIFFKTEEHIDAEEIKEKLFQIYNYNIKIIEIENILKVLTEYGFAQKIKFENQKGEFYEHLHFQQHHDHFICTKCKKIFEFFDENLEKMQRSISSRYGIPISHKMEIYGICNDCKGEREVIRPLNFISSGNLVFIKEISGGKEYKRRMNDLGFFVKEPLKVINNTGFGPVIVEIKNSRLALGKKEAEKILVSTS